MKIEKSEDGRGVNQEGKGERSIRELSNDIVKKGKGNV